MDISREIKDLSKLRPEVTAWRVAIDWLTILSVIYYSEIADHILVYILSVAIIGSRMHALGIISHDLVHYRFIKNRKYSDVFGNLFLCWPLFFTLEGYRAQHLRHHSKLNTSEDPDFIRRVGLLEWTFPMSPLSFYGMLLKDLTGLNVLQYPAKIFKVKTNNKKIKIENDYLNLKYIASMVLFYAILVGLLTAQEGWTLFLLYWVVPIATSLKVIKRIRAFAEHFAVPDGNYDEVTRTTLSSGLERYLIGAHNVGYHTEHHRFASVPWYNLEQLHEIALKGARGYHWGRLTQGYFTGLFQEATRLNIEKSDEKSVENLGVKRANPLTMATE